LNENLGKQVRSGFGWDLTGTFFKQISTLIVSVILARLLTPEEFGIIGMAMVFVSLSQIFVEVGFSQGLIQSEHNSQRAYSSVFYLTFALGLIVGALIYFTAPLVGLFFESDKVSKGEYTEVIRWLSLVPIISSFGSIHNTRFVRNLQFKILAFRNVLSTVLGGIVGVVMAYLGYGVYALVGQQLTTISLFVIILWWKSDWFPTWEFSFEEIKQLIN
jgi:O-antigen/teichoic acid export membrane protein